MQTSSLGGGALDRSFQQNTFQSGKLVFISHNRADKPIAERLGLYLVGEDIGVWYDSWELSAGDSLVGKIDEALSACTHFIVVWSKHATCSSPSVRGDE